MDGIWVFALQIGLWVLNTFIADLVKREEMKASFQQFIANRQLRANATIEIKDNLDEQNEDLDKVQEIIENQKKEKKK